MNTLETQSQELSAQDAVVSRRRFLVAGTIAGLSAGLLFEPASVFAQQRPDARQRLDITRYSYGRHLPEEARRDSVYSLTRSRFTPHLGDQFSVMTGDVQSISLNLYRINDLQRPPDSEGRDEQRDKELSFSLIFVGPLDQPLKQQLCAFKHQAFDQFRVLVVPVGSDDNVRYYEVVFNRLYP
jgi:hypothetical protein